MPINASRLELFGETGILYARQKKDYRDDLEDLFEASYGADIDITYSKYIGIPLIAGVQYAQSPTEGAVFLRKQA